jgi:chloride channel 3/4/5
MLVVITAITSYWLPYTKVLSSEAIHAFFYHCGDEGMPFADTHMMGLCSVDESGIWTPNLDLSVCYMVLAAGLLRYSQMCITFGCGVPCGLFVPSLYTGAAVGRIVGHLAIWFFPMIGINGVTPHPGIYSMVGAAAVLGGVTRVTISLVVIMFELTSGLQLIVPFMVAVLISKAVGDCFTGGVYDVAIMLRGYPYLHEPDDLTFETRACDIMDTELECFFSSEARSAKELLQVCNDCKHKGRPVLHSPGDRRLLGYVTIKAIQDKLEELLAHKDPFFKESTMCSFTKDGRNDKANLWCIVDVNVITVVPETPCAQVHNIFRQLGDNLILVTRFGDLEGMITKKGFVHALEAHGHMKHDPAVEGHDDFAPVAAFDGNNNTPLLTRDPSRGKTHCV